MHLLCLVVRDYQITTGSKGSLVGATKDRDLVKILTEYSYKLIEKRTTILVHVPTKIGMIFCKNRPDFFCKSCARRWGR